MVNTPTQSPLVLLSMAPMLANMPIIAMLSPVPPPPVIPPPLLVDPMPLACHSIITSIMSSWASEFEGFPLSP